MNVSMLPKDNQSTLKPKNFMVNELLKLNFVQLIDRPTHREGGVIDHLYMCRPDFFKEVIVEWELFAPFYSDHFGISVIINKGNKPFLKMPLTISDDLIAEGSEAETLSSRKKSKQPSKNKRKGDRSSMPPPKRGNKN